MVEKKRAYNPRVETRLAKADFQRLDELANLEGVSKSQVVRDAVLWYLEHKDEARAKPREAEIARAIGEMTNRVCAMLARQGATIGTLYELTWRGLPDNEEARKSFQSAVNAAKQRMRGQLDKDEKDLAEKMKDVVAPW
ncbi:MAG: ribbon-helix-helix protein, CopG family [Candidatus Obscuribacterales bacterium]|nr:ribbon-helix-helix protein, CopG family [Candidatus Obscuribacterales bacterium]